GLLNVGVVGPMGQVWGGESAQTFFAKRLATVPGAAAALRDFQQVTRVRGVGPLARRVLGVAGPGWLLAGDAAGFLDPFTGEGVYRALRGGRLVAEAISRALGDGGADETVIGEYERLRRRAFEDKERLCRLVQL